VALIPYPATIAEFVRYFAVGSVGAEEDFYILDELESCRQADGTLHLKLLYPQRAEGDKSNEWRQTSNPVTADVPGVEGYDPIDIQMDFNFWGGLEHGSPWPRGQPALGRRIHERPGPQLGFRAHRLRRYRKKHA
jgi:hypothetical protein